MQAAMQTLYQGQEWIFFLKMMRFFLHLIKQRLCVRVQSIHVLNEKSLVDKFEYTPWEKKFGAFLFFCRKTPRQDCVCHLTGIRRCWVWFYRWTFRRFQLINLTYEGYTASCEMSVPLRKCVDTLIVINFIYITN